MKRTNDPLLTVFLDRTNSEAREAFMLQAEQQSADRRASKSKPSSKTAGTNKPPADSKPATTRARTKSLIKQVDAPESIAKGETLRIKIGHALPTELGDQILTVTIKEGNDGKRIERKTVRVAGNGIAEVDFVIPNVGVAESISIAAFVGELFTERLDQAKPVTVSIDNR